MTSINERIRLILDRAGITNKDVADWLGMTNSRLSQKFKAGIWDSVDELKVIAERTGYSLDSLITGVGFDGDLPVVMEAEQPAYGVRRIPFYDVEAVGGLNGGDVSPVAYATGTIDIGDFLRDSEAAIRMAGNSMMPGYPPGCILGLIPKKNKSITPGEVYVYEDEDGRHCKRLFYKNDDPSSDVFYCYSDTTTVFESGARKGKLFYPPYEIKADSIIKLFSVVGVIKRNSSGVIKYKK